MEPGTGTQYAPVATLPRDDDYPNVKRINGKTWKVGHDYLDTEIADVCELVEIVRKSSWCSTTEPENGAIRLRFEYERYEGSRGRVEIDPYLRDVDTNDRFIERYERPAPRGMRL